MVGITFRRMAFGTVVIVLIAMSASDVRAQTFEQAQEAFAAKRYEQAAALFRQSRPGLKRAQWVDSVFFEGECYAAVGRSFDAHRMFAWLLKHVPDSPRLGQAIAREYEIGVAFVEGKAQRPGVFGDTTDQELGAEILLGLVDSYQQNYFDYALFVVGEYHFLEQDWRRAADLYLRVETEFANSVWAGAAAVQRARCYMHFARGYRYDQSALGDAAKLLETYLARYPKGNHVKQARSYLAEIHERQARHYVDTARYYFHRAEKPEAALVYLRVLVEQTPATKMTPSALDLLDELERAGGAPAKRAAVLRAKLAPQQELGAGT